MLNLCLCCINIGIITQLLFSVLVICCKLELCYAGFIFLLMLELCLIYWIYVRI